jgi:thiamine biosynthesis lipoprotein
VKALVDAWKVRDKGTLPSSTVIAKALQQTQIEEGAFGKGYAIDRMLALLPAGTAMINFGGQIAVRGPLEVSVADPADRAHPVLVLELRDASISTSSGSEKTFAVDGRRFSHILDPRTGEALPPRGSVSVIAREALTADILSTALYVMGEDDGLRWADANGVAAIFITSNRNVRLSAAAREHVRELRLLDRKFKLKD